MRNHFPRRACAVVLLVCLGFLTAGQLRAGDALDHWHWRNPLPQGNSLANVVWANNQYVALGELGTLLTSTDGTTWTAQQSTTLDQLRDCAYGNGTYVTVGDYGTVLTSTNGVDWTPQFGGTFYSLNGVTFGNNRFVAVGAGGNILTSEDGQDWTLRVIGPWIYYDVIYAENTFVAGGETNIVTSTDGIVWTQRSFVNGDSVRSIAYGGGKFAAVVSTRWGGARLWVSDDAISWRENGLFYSGSKLAISYGNGIWVVFSGYSDDYNSFTSGYLYTSPDAVNWTTVSTNSIGISGLVYGEGKFLAACGNGQVLASTNGADWSGPSFVLSSYSANLSWNGWGLTDLVYANGAFLGVGGSQVAFSANGQEWTSVAVDTNASFPYDGYVSVAFGEGRYVIGGQGGKLLTSTDGLNWTNPAPELGSLTNMSTVTGLAYGNGVFVGVCGNSKYVLTSPDGLVWSGREVLGTNVSASINWTDVAFGNGLFVAISSSGYSATGGFSATSSDGVYWTLQQQDPYSYRAAITYGQGKFVSVGYRSIRVSRDGLNWVECAPALVGGLVDVAYGGGWFVAVGYNDTPLENPYRGESPIWVSRDGYTWSRRAPLTRRSLSGVAYGNGTFVAISGDGAILQSDPFVNLSFDLLSGPRLTVTGPNDRWFTIESTESLNSAAGWHTETAALLQGGTATIPAPSFAPAANRFYRAKLLP